MRLVTFRAGDGSSHVGVRQPDCVVDVTACAAAQGSPSLRHVGDVLSLGADWQSLVHKWTRQATSIPEGERTIPLDAAPLLPPLGCRGLILGTGGNFRTHRREMAAASGTELAPPAHPRCFIKNSASVIGHEAAIRLPSTAPGMVDYEGEVAIVIGLPCYEVPAGSVDDYIAGYTLLNDVSARDWVPAVRGAATSREAVDAWERNIMGKQFPTFCPVGSEFVTTDEVDRPADIDLRTLVNGEVRQDATLADLEFGPGELVARFSRYFSLRPGDIVTTGTPSGVAVGMATPRFLQAGDQVAVESSALGVTLTNVVAGAG